MSRRLDARWAWPMALVIAAGLGPSAAASTTGAARAATCGASWSDWVTSARGKITKDERPFVGVKVSQEQGNGLTAGRVPRYLAVFSQDKGLHLLAAPAKGEDFKGKATLSMTGTDVKGRGLRWETPSGAVGRFVDPWCAKGSTRVTGGTYLFSNGKAFGTNTAQAEGYLTRK
ncbi:hypothetical protein ACFWA9_13295 [Kitasatospora sp. NPDC059973]|uniref:hypothetical protein n=1 Tax=Kitasatospora sp. NPDC059973 TaxID=3347020 RepID=UPI00369245D5